MAAVREVITLTFGEQAENHKGMEILGHALSAGEGFQLEDLEQMSEIMSQMGCDTELHSMESGHAGTEHAHVLVIRQGVRALLGQDHSDLFEEQKALTYDKKAFMYGRVVNKNARWNLCFDDREVEQEPDYATGKGRVIPLHSVSLLQTLHHQIGEIFGEKARDLKVESNYYYDADKCGIGYHGDSERRRVIGVRLGTVGVPIHYQWFHEGAPVGERMDIELEPGDIYVMSEKAVGTDWKKRSAYTLRHAVGRKFNSF